MFRVVVVLALMVASCSSKKDSVPDTVDSTSSSSSSAANCGDVEQVTLTTSDGVSLAADYHPPKKAGMGAIILLHMIPPNFDRSSYPARVRTALTASGVALINVDRRGAGESQGTATEAYDGPKGEFDVSAAAAFLSSPDRMCASDAANLMLIGASNGTTSVFDHVVARTFANLPVVKAMAWLSPGSYTENQNQIAANETLLKALPTLIIHPENEPWANTYTNYSPQWKVVELKNGNHGTSNFDNGSLEQTQLSELVGWVDAHLIP